MKNFINNVQADKLTYRGFIFSFITLALTTVYTLFYYNSLPPYIPLFNQLPWGNQRITPTWGIFIPILLCLAIVAFNLFFTSIVYSKNPLIGRIVAATTLLIAIMNFLFIIRTVIVII